MLLESLFLNANVTFQDARNRQNPNSATFDAQQKGVPDKFASVFACYEPSWIFVGTTPRFTLGVEYQDERTISSGTFGLPDAELPSQTVWEAGVDLAPTEGRWTTSLRVLNLTDELAYQRAMFLGGQSIVPRSVYFTLRWNL